MYIIIFLSLLSAAFSLERIDILKTFPKRNIPSQVEMIDEIYVINLDSRKEKMEKMEQRLGFYGIVPYRFSAIIGSKIALDQLNIIGSKLPEARRDGPVKVDFKRGAVHSSKIGTNTPVFYPHITQGALGCTLSHLSILKNAQDNDYNYIWVLEDDVVFLKDPRKIHEDIEKLDALVGEENWDILYMDDFNASVANFYRMDLGSVFLDYLKFNRTLPSNKIALFYEKQKRISYHKYLSKSDLLFPQSIPSCYGRFRKNTVRYGTYSMIIKKTGITKILHFYEKRGVFLPYDDELSLIPELNTYNVVDPYVRVETEITDTR